MSSFIHRLRAVLAPYGMLLASTLVLPVPVAGAAQEAVLHGVVVDAATGRGVAGATVRYEGSKGQAVVEADPEGRFEVRLPGTGPVKLWVDQLGYEAVELEAEPGEEVRVELVAEALAVQGLEVSAEREEVSYRYGIFFGTERGLLWPGRSNWGCYFQMLDSVVIKDPELLRLDVRERYPRPAFIRRYFSESVAQRREYIDDPRLLRDAWPCGVVWLRRHRQMERLRAMPEVPAPTGERQALEEQWSVALEGLDVCPGEVAVSGRGRLVRVDAERARAVELDERGQVVREVGLRPVDGGGRRRACTVRVGWHGEAWWVLDAEGREVVMVQEDGREERRGPAGVVAGGWKAERGLPGWPTGMDRAMPEPVEGGRWLWTAAAADPPTPPLREDAPAGREVVVLNDEWKLERVAAVLRPGAEVVDVVLGGRGVVGEQPLGDHPLWGVDESGETMTVVRREHERAVWLTTYRVLRIGLARADTVWEVERWGELKRLGDREWNRWEAELAERAGPAEPFGGEAGRSALVGALLYRSPIEPMVTGLGLGGQGMVWLRRPAGAAERVVWEVLDGEGEALWWFEAERGLEVLNSRGETMWGLVREEGGRARLVRYRLRPAGETVR